MGKEEEQFTRALDNLIDYVVDGRMEPLDKDIEEDIDIITKFRNKLLATEEKPSP